VFLLIGVELPVIAAALLDQQSQSWGHVAFLVAVLSGVAIGVRFLWIFTATYGVRLLVPSAPEARPGLGARLDARQLVRHARRRDARRRARAAARHAGRLAVPERELVILLAFGIVFVTLVGQGLTLPAVIRGLRLEKDRSAEARRKPRARRCATRRSRPWTGWSRRTASRRRRRTGEALLQQRPATSPARHARARQRYAPLAQRGCGPA
jgi:CPA1 family monovalent cation:H+ antiporter